jgi:hypothetical protein
MKEIAIWLGGMQVQLFESNHPVYMDVFCSGEGIRKIICSYYDRLVSEGKIFPIEVLEPEFKKELKELAKDIGAGRLNIDGLVQLCKCLHVLAYHKTI